MHVCVCECVCVCVCVYILQSVREREKEANPVHDTMLINNIINVFTVTFESI